MTFVFPSVNGTVKPKERSGHVAVHYDGYIVVWGGYNRVRIICIKILLWAVVYVIMKMLALMWNF